MFALVIPGRPCMVEYTQVSETQFAFTFPSTPHFNHIVIFMLPGDTLPAEVAAGVYLQLPGEPEFKFLGALANEKQSAIFKVNLPQPATTNNLTYAGMNGGSIAGQQQQQAVVNLGISVEPIPNIKTQMDQLQSRQSLSSTSAASGSKPSPVTTKILAQRIIKNAFNFLAGFSGSLGPGGQEVVPLKSFQDWWTKFERKIEMDPSFLEREQND